MECVQGIFGLPEAVEEAREARQQIQFRDKFAPLSNRLYLAVQVR